MDPRKEGPFTFGRWKFSHEPFYVGKGHGLRYQHHFVSSTRKARRGFNYQKRSLLQAIDASGMQPIVVLKKVGLTEATAFDYEIALINAIGRLDIGEGPLTNLTDGGDGGAGHRQGKALRERRSKIVKEWWDTATEGQKRDRAENQKITKSKWSAAKRREVSAKISLAKIQISAITRKRLSSSVKAHYEKAGVRDAHSKACTKAQVSRGLVNGQAALDSGAEFLNLKVLEKYKGGGVKLKHKCLKCAHIWVRLPSYTTRRLCGCPECGTRKNRASPAGRMWYHDPGTLKNFQIYPDDPRVPSLVKGRARSNK